MKNRERTIVAVGLIVSFVLGAVTANNTSQVRAAQIDDYSMKADRADDILYLQLSLKDGEWIRCVSGLREYEAEYNQTVLKSTENPSCARLG